VGTAGHKVRKFTYEGKFPKSAKQNEFIPRLWATRKIGFLLDNIRLSGEQKELVDEVISLSKRYGIVTPYTSYLVTEDQVVDVEALARKVTDLLEKTELNFETKRHLLEALRAEATLLVVDGEKRISLLCVLGAEVLGISGNTISG